MAGKGPHRAKQIAISALLLACLLSLFGATVARGASKPPESGKYLGVSTASSNTAVSFTVSANGKRITSFTSSVGYNGKCGQGGGPTFAFTVPVITIAKSGHFSATAQGKDNALRGTIRISGVIAKQSAHGTIVELKPFSTCRPPNQKVNPFSETFTASRK